MIHYFGWNELWLPLPSFSFSLRSVCPPTQQMAKVKHISVLWCTSLCVPCKWQRCQSPTLFHPVSQTSVLLWRHLHDLHLQFITSRKEILEILGRFFLPSTLHFTLCATGSVCVYPAHAELKISRFHSGRWQRGEELKKIRTSLKWLPRSILTKKDFAWNYSWESQREKMIPIIVFLVLCNVALMIKIEVKQLNKIRVTCCCVCMCVWVYVCVCEIRSRSLRGGMPSESSQDRHIRAAYRQMAVSDDALVLAF